MITDVHTHCLNATEAIINASTNNFCPTEGHYYSLGIHPWDIENTDCESALKSIEETAQQNKQVVAIGECGLDSNIETDCKKQILLFEKHIELSERLHLPLIIHCVRCSNEIIRLHRKHKPSQAWIIHGFRSKETVLRQFLAETDIYLSVGEKFNSEALKAIPHDRLLLETDESPLPIEDIADLVAQVRNQSVQELLEIASSNAIRVLGI